MLRALRLVRRAVGPPGAAACRRYHRPPALPALVPAATRAESPSSPPALQRQERANTPTRARAGARSWQPASPKRQRALDINELIMGAQTPARVLAVISSARAEFNNVNLATALHRIAKLTSAQPGADRKAFFHEHEAQVRELLAEIRAELPSFAGRQLAACAYASSLICNGLAQPLLSDVRSLLVAVGPIAAPQVATLHSQGLANLAWAHAQADVPSTDVFDALTPVALARLSEFTIEGLSALAWSYAKLQLHEPELAGAIGREVVARFMSRDSGDAGSANADAAAGAPNAHAATHIRPRELTNLAWSFGRLRVPERGALFDALADIAVEQIGAFNTRDLSQLVWSYAKAGHAAPLLFDEIARVAPARLSHFNSQDFANMTCAYASAGMCADELFRAVALEVEPRLDEFTAQGLANLAWAFAKAGAPSARVLLESIAAVFPPRLPDLGPRQLAMLVWAFSKNGASSEAPFRAVEHELGSRKLADFNHVELVNTAWAFATARVSAPALFTRIGAEVAVRAPEFGAQTLANAAWSLARSRAPARRAFSAICAEVEGRPLDIFSAQQLANLIWAFSIAGCDAHRLLSAVAPEVTRRAAEFKPVELANLAWAMAVSSSFSSGAIELPLRKALVLALVERIDALEHETDVRAPLTHRGARRTRLARAERVLCTRPPPHTEPHVRCASSPPPCPALPPRPPVLPFLPAPLPAPNGARRVRPV